MTAPTATRLLALAVVALFAVSAFAVAGTAAIASTPLNNSAAAAPTAAQPLATPSAAPAPTAAPISAVSSSNIAASMAASAAAATKAAGVNPHFEFPPRPSATPSQVAATKAAGYVQPLYTGTPAPLGLAYYGYQANNTGAVIPTILNTSSVQAYVDAKDIAASDLYQSSPDSYGIQLNAVTTNVTLFGQGGYSFWTQNVVEYYPAAGFLVLITNVWNFSGGPLSSNVFYTHGPYGYQVGTEYYYSEVEIPANIQYPWNLTLTMTSNLTGGRDAVYFSIGMTGASVPTYPTNLTNFTYDYVVFNSVAGTPMGSVLASPYSANGFSYNPVGLTDDFELIFGGPGGGSHSDLSAADATLGLAYWNGSAYVSVPSAESYGGETGETTTGAAIAWTGGPHGPGNLSTYGVMTTGPAIMQGLWNTTTPEGADPVTIAATPANAFSFVTPLGTNSNWTIPETQYAPTIYNDTFDLAPGSYIVTTELSGWVPQNTTIVVAGPTIVPVLLLAQLTPTVYTPLWAIGNSELAAISSGGSGTPANPYVLLNDQSGAFGPLFGQYNDYGFPVFPGLYLQNTNASVEVSHAPSLTATTSTFAFPGPYLPSTNTLQEWYWNVSNVSLAYSTISGGWFTQNAYYPAVFDTMNVIFYASSGNLIYNDTFNSAIEGLLLFQGGSLFGPSTGGGGNNTVFGTTFNQVQPQTCPTPACEVLMSFGEGIGLTVAENNDVIFNNAFGTPTTAWLLPINLYSGFPLYFNNTTWNVTSGSHPAPLADFPQFSLDTHNILGGSALGGNYWWDYGYPLNPFNGAYNPLTPLPYDENATTLLAYVYGCDPYYCASYIYHGGDYAPLGAFDQFQAVSIHETGLPNGAPWGANIQTPVTFPSELVDVESTVGGYNPVIVVPHGTYVPTSLFAGQQIRTPLSFAVNTSTTTVTLVFQTLRTYGYLSFHESGLPIADTWTVAVYPSGHPSEAVEQASTTNLNVVLLPRGSYTFVVFNTTDGYIPRLSTGTVTVAALTSLSIRFEALVYPLLITEEGLAPGTHWSVQLTPYVVGHSRKITLSSTTASIGDLLANGTYGVTVKPVKGYYMFVSGLTNGNITVAGGPVNVTVAFTTAKYFVTFSETGLPYGTGWSATLNGDTVSSNFSTISLLEPNGTYHYTIGAVAGYSESSHPSAVHVSGHAVTIYVTFRATAAVMQGDLHPATAGLPEAAVLRA